MTSSSCSRLKVQDKTKSTTQKLGESVRYLKLNHQKEGAARKIFLYVRTSRQTYKFYPKWWRTQYWAIKGKGSSEETETFLPCGNISKNWSTDFRPVMNLQDPIILQKSSYSMEFHETRRRSCSTRFYVNILFMTIKILIRLFITRLHEKMFYVNVESVCDVRVPNSTRESSVYTIN